MSAGREKNRSAGMLVSVMGKGGGGVLCAKKRQMCCGMLEGPLWLTFGDMNVGIEVDDIDVKSEFGRRWMDASWSSSHSGDSSKPSKPHPASAGATAQCTPSYWLRTAHCSAVSMQQCCARAACSMHACTLQHPQPCIDTARQATPSSVERRCMSVVVGITSRTLPKAADRIVLASHRKSPADSNCPSYYRCSHWGRMDHANTGNDEQCQTTPPSCQRSRSRSSGASYTSASPFHRSIPHQSHHTHSITPHGTRGPARGAERWNRTWWLSAAMS